MTDPYVIEFTADELSVADQWHGGLSSMLYAIASTGALRRGSIRPRYCETDAEWFIHIAERLADEADAVAVMARKFDEDEDIEVLTRIAAKARMAAEKVRGS